MPPPRTVAGPLQASLAAVAVLFGASPAHAGAPPTDPPASDGLHVVPIPPAAPASAVPAEPPPLPPDRIWVVPALHLSPPDLAQVPTAPLRRSPLLGAANALGANLVVWSFDRFVTRSDWAFISVGSVKDNLNGPWVFDPNSFMTNQLAHPYQGSLSFNAARAAGVGFWGSIPYPIVMSTLWELVGETEKPALNDAITTPVAGIFLGEALFRTAHLILDGGGSKPGVVRELGAAAVSPLVGLTRLETGDRHRARRHEVIPTYLELAATGSFSGRASRDGEKKDTAGLGGLSAHLTYGLPVPGWRFREPFDHFDAKVGVAVSDQAFFDIAVRGLLLARSFGEREGGLGRGLWGLWGVYEAFSPQVFRSSASGLGVGAVRQWAWSSGMALCVTGLAAAGFGAAGADRVSDDARDYHYGLGGLLLLEARLYAADRGLLALSVREYAIGGAVSEESKGEEVIARAELTARLRIVGPHSVGLNVVTAARLGTFSDRPDSNARFHQSTASYVYTPGLARGSGLRPVN